MSVGSNAGLSLACHSDTVLWVMFTEPSCTLMMYWILDRRMWLTSTVELSGYASQGR
jgi:hypothetical protein